MDRSAFDFDGQCSSDIDFGFNKFGSDSEWPFHYNGSLDLAVVQHYNKIQPSLGFAPPGHLIEGPLRSAEDNLDHIAENPDENEGEEGEEEGEEETITLKCRAARPDRTSGIQNESTRKNKLGKTYKVTKHKIKVENLSGLMVDIEGLLHPAIYHHEYIQRQSAEALDPKQYTYPRASGRFGCEDITTFLQSQKDWGPDRAHRPTVLSTFDAKRTAPHLPLSLLTVNDQETGVEIVIIDALNHQPLRNFPFLPAGISTKIEGYLLEAYSRMDRRLGILDILQRMPLHKMKLTQFTRQDYHRISKRRSDFRIEAKLLCWESHKHDSVYDVALIAEMKARPADLRANTTQNLQDRSRQEVLAMAAETKATGKYAHRGVRGKRQQVEGRVSGFQTQNSDLTGGLEITQPPRRSHKLTSKGHGKGNSSDLGDSGDGLSGRAQRASSPSPACTGLDQSSDLYTMMPPPLAAPGPRRRSSRATSSHSSSSSSRKRSYDTDNSGSLSYKSPPKRARDDVVGQPASSQGTEAHFKTKVSTMPGGYLPALDPALDLHQPFMPLLPTGIERSPDMGAIDADARLFHTTCSEDRRQLFMALYSTAREIASNFPHATIKMDLSQNYGNGWRDLRATLVRLVKHHQPDADPEVTANNLSRLKKWRHGIGCWDLADKDVDVALAIVFGDHDLRESMKERNSPMIFSTEAAFLAEEFGLLSEAGMLVEMPDVVYVKLVGRDLNVVGMEMKQATGGSMG